MRSQKHHSDNIFELEREEKYLVQQSFYDEINNLRKDELLSKPRLLMFSFCS